MSLLPTGLLPSGLSPTPTVPRFLSETIGRAVIAQLLADGLPDTTPIELVSRWRGDVRWARNRIQTASDWRDDHLALPQFTCNQVDAPSLHAAVERVSALGVSIGEPPVMWAQPETYPAPHIWSEATYAQAPGERSTVAARLVAPAEQAGMLSAGYLCVEARGTLSYLGGGQILYAPQTFAQCSLTVRDPKGTGSGWAGGSSYDWNRIDTQKLAAIAVEKCLRSRNPVKVEPGRYTTILEPQAAFELFRQLLNVPAMLMQLALNESPGRSGSAGFPFQEPPVYRFPVGPFDSEVTYGGTKLGELVLDARLTIRSDPLDPDLGTLAFSDRNHPLQPVTWVDHGVLTTLATDAESGLNNLHRVDQSWSGAFRVDGSGPPVSMEEMIATTTRGLLVTRFWDVQRLDDINVLCNGLTRDGLWLIEHGKISKPVQNFRFTESPLFAFNNVEQVGAPVPVFSPEVPALVPAIKVRDFSFTAVADAV